MKNLLDASWTIAIVLRMPSEYVMPIRQTARKQSWLTFWTQRTTLYPFSRTMCTPKHVEFKVAAASMSQYSCISLDALNLFLPIETLHSKNFYETQWNPTMWLDWFPFHSTFQVRCITSMSRSTSYQNRMKFKTKMRKRFSTHSQWVSFKKENISSHIHFESNIGRSKLPQRSKLNHILRSCKHSWMFLLSLFVRQDKWNLSL